jgi:hypothetical protein
VGGEVQVSDIERGCLPDEFVVRDGQQECWPRFGPEVLPRFEWHNYDTNELHWIVDHSQCVGEECDVDGCWGLARGFASIDVTWAYRYLLHNLATVVALAAAEQRGRLATGALEVRLGEDPDDMCPNCCTPWKCNGPHLQRFNGEWVDPDDVDWSWHLR